MILLTQSICMVSGIALLCFHYLKIFNFTNKFIYLVLKVVEEQERFGYSIKHARLNSFHVNRNDKARKLNHTIRNVISRIGNIIN